MIMALSVLALFLPLITSGAIAGDRALELGDLPEAHQFLTEGMQTGSLSIGGPFGAGDVLTAQGRRVIVPARMSGEVGTADFCIEQDGFAMQRKSLAPVKGRCESLLLYKD